MSSEKRLGLYWGSKDLSIVEVVDNMPVLVCRFAYKTDDGVAGTGGSDDIRTATFIQQALRDSHIEGKQVSVAIPNTESMIRSFVLPAMSSSETEKVVAFEIKKYIPFPLEQIVYIHQAFPIADKNVKKIQIVLAAIRREVLFQYSRVLEQSGLNVYSSEPAAVSLIRALIFKKEIRVDQKVVVIVLEPSLGQIIFVQKGVGEFVREFSLAAAVPGQVVDDQVVKKKLINEVHMSIDFYNRQFNEDKISQILLVSTYADGQLIQDLTKDFGAPVKHVSPGQIVTNPSADIQSIYAFGASIALNPVLRYAFNFSKKQAKTDNSFVANIDWSFFERVGKTTVFCLLVFLLCWVYVTFNIQQLKKKVVDLFQYQQSFSGLSAEEILAKATKNGRDLAEYKNIRLSSQMSKLLVYIPQVFGEGIWLRDLNARYTSGLSKGTDTGLLLELSGYVSFNDANKEIRVVNDLTARIKNHPELGKYFKNAVINTVERQVYQDRTVTFFTMNCS